MEAGGEDRTEEVEETGWSQEEEETGRMRRQKRRQDGGSGGGDRMEVEEEKTGMRQSRRRGRGCGCGYAPLSHWKPSLQLTAGSLQAEDGWQGRSSTSSRLQAEPPNWDGLRTERVRNCSRHGRSREEER